MTHPLLIVIEETSQRRGKFSAHLLGLVDSPQPLTVPQNAPVSQPAGAAHACRGSARTGDESDET